MDCKIPGGTRGFCANRGAMTMTKFTRFILQGTVMLLPGLLAMPVLATNVAMFANPTYTASDTGTDNETDNMNATMVALGHTVSQFSGITAADFTAAVSGKP